MKQQPFSLLIFIILINFTVSVKAQDARLIAKNALPSILMLEMQDANNRAISLGSGFFVRPDVVATNYHVIKGAVDGFAKVVGNPSIYRIEGVVGVDQANDLALIKIKGVIGKPLILADISKIEVGEEVFALGNPKGLEGTISPGIISGSSLRKINKESLIQITAPISPGSSGGPVVNRKGQVIGVAVASLKDGQNLNFAVPSSYLALLIANAKSVVSLSSVKGSRQEKSLPDPGSSFAETTTWITDKLTAKVGTVPYNPGEIYKNEHFSFDNCTMKYVGSVRKLGFILYSTSTVDLSLLNYANGVSSGHFVFLMFSNNDVLVKSEDFYEGRNVFNENSRFDSIKIFVGERETMERVTKSFNHLGMLCKENKKKEPF